MASHTAIPFLPPATNQRLRFEKQPLPSLITIKVLDGDDPAWWPYISATQFLTYWIVASTVVVVYDWVFSFAQEIELIWRQRWSYMTVLYICVRYIGILYSFITILWILPVVMADMVSNIVYFMWTWTPVVINAMLGVILMTRIHAMYGRSSKMLIFLVALLLVCTIATGVVTGIGNMGVTVGEGVLSGYHLCVYDLDAYGMSLNEYMIIPTAVWEILAFFLAVWIVILHFRELRQSQRGSTIGDCFTALIQSHALYFLAFAVVACFNLGSLSSTFMDSPALGVGVYDGILNISQAFQMCVLGPRLILSVRQFNARVVAKSDEGTHMTSIAFQAGGNASTGGDA